MRRNNWIPTMFNDFFDTEFMPKINATAPAINVIENDKEYRVELAAPGMKKDDFTVHINQDGNLSVKMESKKEDAHKENKGRYLRREFSYSKFEQTLILPDDVEKEKISAKVSDGVLTVTLPKQEVKQAEVARQITVEE
ncbi:MAG: Hsp20/alpha crystallin family protein [Bacteroidales bacterium]|nr:Hsp20/alpha crystallin family protein [Bacteroidales bacterium]